MHCRTAEAWMVAARDGELGARRRRLLDRHLERCPTCRAEMATVGNLLGALDGLPQEAEVPARLEHAVLRRVRAMAAEDDGRDALAVALEWLQRLTPAIAATAVIALAVVGVRSADVGSRKPEVARAAASRPHPTVARRTTVRPPDDPPAALASRPDLFVDLPMLRELDKLEHFDSIAAMDDGDAVRPSGDGSPSNG